MSLLLAEELLLLSLDDTSGQGLLPEDVIAEGVASALVFELTLRGTLKRSSKRLQRDPTVTIRDPLLAEAAERAHGQSVEDAVHALASPGTLEALVGRLVSVGALNDAELWAPGAHWPTGARADAQVRSRLEDILTRGADPTEREAILVGLLEQLDLTARVVSHPHQARLRTRASEVAGSARPLRSRPRTTSPGSLAGHLLDLVLLPTRWRR